MNKERIIVSKKSFRTWKCADDPGRYTHIAEGGAATAHLWLALVCVVVAGGLKIYLFIFL
jgi:hypothetical protein